MTTTDAARASAWALMTEWSTSDGDDDAIAGCLLELRARVEQLEQAATCPHIVSTDEGTSYCGLGQQQALLAEAQPQPVEPTTETLPDGAIKVCVGDRCGTVSSWHLVEVKAAQLRQLGPAQLAADIRVACDSTWIHQPVVAALLELAGQMERQPISPADLRAVATELSRYP